MAATRQAERKPQTVSPAALRPSRLRVRWDRVTVLLALLGVLTTVTAHTVISAVSERCQLNRRHRQEQRSVSPSRLPRHTISARRLRPLSSTRRQP